jgi:acetyl esterase/lipase
MADHVFAEHASGPLHGTLYLPQSARQLGYVVQVHGGGWCSGDRDQDSAVCEWLARQGIAVFAIDFRMPPQATYPAAVEDVRSALRWLQTKAAGSGARSGIVGLLGMSSGGHLAALTALDPGESGSPCAYWIGCWPVVDPLARFQMARTRGRADLLKNHQAFWTDEAEMMKGSPQHIVDAKRHSFLPPALLIQGMEDENIEPAMTIAFADSYRAAGGSIDVLTFPGESHAFVKRNPNNDSSRDALTGIVDFIKRQTK